MPSAEDPVGPLRPRIQQTLDRFLDRQRDLLEPISEELLPLIDAAADLLRGGKRLRPAFCYWGWRAADEFAADDDVVITTGAALELFQAAALVHDDVIDDSDTRRGRPSTHRRFATHHLDARWHGDGSSFGRATAILVGDLLLGWSDEMFSTAGLSESATRRARPVFERMRTEVGAGQYLDILAQADTAVSPADQVERARRVIVHKSARYSVEHPLVLGGRIAGAPEQLVDEYSKYGGALGEAFQLRDDILGVFGDPRETGKPAGDDLREGKRTVLVAYARQHASSAQAKMLTDLLGDPDLDIKGVDHLRQVLVDTGAVGRVEARITELISDAEAALKRAALHGAGQQALASLITLATTRTR
ncbi:polyprenyl synthetase family protein [Phytoactinopolyspora mesophila]|uniref:Polyprenyl synthetase family protein n=1 Tax=Phytoactinopolyspora mesophila TaxID=2650750 RepID=A0A7K3M0A6_9ACTN|nr:polyprenyl synthetase family protein [Phytoactinopolyspora mesophila]NDL56342.1 polyprenyl synthetase family protein [Phytoactinopolyspora mesophila]